MGTSSLGKNGETYFGKQEYGDVTEFEIPKDNLKIIWPDVSILSNETYPKFRFLLDGNVFFLCE